MHVNIFMLKKYLPKHKNLVQRLRSLHHEDDLTQIEAPKKL